MRRDPAAVVTAHKMDRERAELYVEGVTDRAFIAWILSREMGRNSIIVDIDQIQWPDGDGNRGRVISFSAWLHTQGCQVKTFVDADYDRILHRRTDGDCVWLTDRRDMEGYLIRQDCFEKLLKLGLGTDSHNAEAMMQHVVAVGRDVGMVRLMSEVHGIALPFQRTKLDRYVHLRSDALALDEERYVRALLQNSHISLARLEEMRDRIEALSREHRSTPSSDIVHGKDIMLLINTYIKLVCKSKYSCERLLWTTFERTMVADYPILARVLSYLRGDALASR